MLMVNLVTNVPFTGRGDLQLMKLASELILTRTRKVNLAPRYANGKR